ncbi:hypothetical protein ACI2KE_00330 [Pseudomonas monteilii]|jgi:hypothetical protein|uniref:hypothetical protein n=1 Tax=Pseudomonas alabamensis TaxID=3064349 RepID=UPI000745E302|nr:hypothetical protein [Pseudomonas entomophila]AMA45901.1 hypothetical protein APT63_09820 [Pseudomonas monteilii]
MRTLPILCLSTTLVLLSGCFDRTDHPAKDADQSKPSLLMKQPDKPITSPTAETEPTSSSEQDH